ncbi:MAG: metallophosphoesterase [Acidobacteria bacterium]|nr:metallophosphoesterase [Acidobacteriota bacterium]
MRIRVLSDLHVDFGALTLPRVDADITVLAGDIRPGKSALTWIRKNFPEHPVVYVLGNHEFYGGAIPKLIDDFRRLCAGTNIHILENDCFEYNGFRFLGCTLWTDFALLGDSARAGRAAADIMNDYRRIRVSPEFRRLRGLDTAGFHARSLQWLREQFHASAARPVIIVTHHAPSARSVDPAQADDIINAAYASNLDDVVGASRARLWIHGHIHRPTDYCIGETRVLSNPGGYPFEAEASGFDPALVVEV